MVRKIIIILALALVSIGPMPANAVTIGPPDGPTLDIYGFVQTDFIHDFNRMDPAWAATLRPSKIPVNCTGATPDAGCGPDGTTLFSVRQSRLGFKAGAPTPMGPMNAKIEFDFFGVGADAGQTTIRLRHVYGELGQFLVGQTNSLFMDGDVFPNTIDYWGPVGMIFFRNIQGRWTPIRTKDMKFAVALESPGSALDTGNVNTTNVNGWTSWNKYPDFTAQLRTDQRWGHAQLAGIYRWLGYQNPLPTVSPNSGHVTGGGVNASGALKTVGRDQLLGQVAYGYGIASYINDCCTDVAPNSALQGAEAVPLLGWLIYYDHYWNDQWSSSVGYSEAKQNTTGGQTVNAFSKGQYASGNLLWYPVKNVMAGLEILWGQRENKDGHRGNDTRTQFSVKYSF
jgi:hypothetical protein